MSSELVTGKTENGEAIVVLVEGMQTCILGSEASLSRDVDDQADLAFIVGQFYGLPLDRGHLEIVNLRHLNLPSVNAPTIGAQSVVGNLLEVQ